MVEGHSLHALRAGMRPEKRERIGVTIKMKRIASELSLVGSVP